jgi:tRNA(Arg) A34 adenosine deaminase TadA
VKPEDIRHLRRCIELATLARERGDDPFGSILVGPDGSVLAERMNEVHTNGDRTAHPELALASWASRHLTPEQRAGSTMYTNGEHCPMCATAQVWAGVGRLVFALSGHTIRALVGDRGTQIAIDSREVVDRSNVRVDVVGPCDELVESAAALFR